VSLGYGRHEVDEVVRVVFEKEPDLDAGSAIRQALKIFASK
jgi:Holliday junction DNA helicase RuvA